VRLFTRNGHDWSDRFPLITEAALRNRNTSFVIEGEAVLPGVDGRSDFNGLHCCKHDDEVQFYAFDILAEGGEDLRRLPLSMRKTNLARLLTRRVDSIPLAPFDEQGEIGPDLFRHACTMGLEGLVSKHRDRPRGLFRHANVTLFYCYDADLFRHAIVTLSRLRWRCRHVSEQYRELDRCGW
jgi:bifunctional non-homologous end joining protein LigD